MAETTEKKWNIDAESIKDPGFAKLKSRFDAAKVQMQLRTNHHELYGLLAKNKSIHEWSIRRGNTKYFSEGSVQYILRKTLSDTIQRVPDGELSTPYDKNSWENIVLQYLFDNKVMWSEYEGIDMMSNLTNSFKMSFIYGFAPVRVGFEVDYDDDYRITYNLENWRDIFINPDCTDIRKPEVVYFRQYMSQDEILELLDKETDTVASTYDEDTVKYIIENKLWTGKEWESEKLGDQLKGSTGTHSVSLITEYRRGANEFVTYCEKTGSVFRRVKNHDPRKGIPWIFLCLEPDPDWPLGLSQVEFLLADQQFNDLFQTSAYKNLLLAMEPPIMVGGWETNPSSYKMEPRKIWNIGNNPNNVKVEPVKVDNSILAGWAQTREAVSAAMTRNLNVMDGTIAADAGVGYSKTAPGVEAQQHNKTININQYQKRMEYFMGDWANMALRLYIESQGGEHTITVDEETRLKLIDIGCEDMIDGVNVKVDFDELSSTGVNFTVRVGSLTELKEDQERQALTDLAQPFIQNLNGWSDSNRQVIENEVLLPIAKRLLELSDVDIAQTLADSLSTQMAKAMMGDMQAQIDQQGMQMAGMQEQMDQMAAAPQAPVQAPGEQLPPAEPLPMPEEPVDYMGAMAPEEQLVPEETPGQEVGSLEELLQL